MDTVRVIIVDDHEVVRLGLMIVLEDVPWVEVVAEAGSADEALAGVSTHQPDAVIMDIRLPGTSGIEACRQITQQWPNTKVIMLTSYTDDELVFQAVEAKACGYVLKQVGNQALIEALKKIRLGGGSLDPVATQQEINGFHQSERVRQGTIFKDLTEREMIVLAKITRGKTNHQVAGELAISEQTVYKITGSILVKLGVDNRFSAIICALRHKIEYYLPERNPINHRNP